MLAGPYIILNVDIVLNLVSNSEREILPKPFVMRKEAQRSETNCLGSHS